MCRKLFYFNPTCEMAVCNGHTSYMPPQHLRRFEHDLATLPLWLSRNDDVVLVRGTVDTEFLETLSKQGFNLPRFLQPEGIKEAGTFDELHPWGWSPAAHKHLDTIKTQVAENWHNHPMSSWKPEHRELLSRLSGIELYRALPGNVDHDYDLLEVPSIPTIISSFAHFQKTQNEITYPAILKTPWSASGRGLFIVDEPGTKSFSNPNLLGKLKQQGFLTAEPFLDKILDVSFHFWSSHEKISYLGHSLFKTDSKGQFLGCYLHTPEVGILNNFPLSDSLQQAQSILHEALTNMHINSRYQGPIGIDGLFFRNSANAIKLHPCIEMNLRYTMGLLNIELREKIQTQGRGFWQIVNVNRAEWDKLANEKSIVTDGKSICRGILPLTPPPKHSGYMACLKI